MIVIPAIDLRDGKVVRLTQGDYDRQVSYSENPEAMAKDFESKGAARIHVVDLDGAKSGKPTQADAIGRIIRSVKSPVQVGGGMRTVEIIDRVLSLGAARVVVGTRAALDRGFLKEVLKAFGKRIIVGVDSRDGMVATDGWTKITDIRTEELLGQVIANGGSETIVTDIATDGMLKGPNLGLIKRLLEKIPVDLIASGGVGSLDDIRALNELKAPRLIGVITGKAIYEGKLDLKKAIELTR